MQIKNIDKIFWFSMIFILLYAFINLKNILLTRQIIFENQHLKLTDSQIETFVTSISEIISFISVLDIFIIILISIFTSVLTTSFVSTTTSTKSFSKFTGVLIISLIIITVSLLILSNLNDTFYLFIDEFIVTANISNGESIASIVIIIGVGFTIYKYMTIKNKVKTVLKEDAEITTLEINFIIKNISNLITSLKTKSPCSFIQKDIGTTVQAFKHPKFPYTGNMLNSPIILFHMKSDDIITIHRIQALIHTFNQHRPSFDNTEHMLKWLDIDTSTLTAELQTRWTQLAEILNEIKTLSWNSSEQK